MSRDSPSRRLRPDPVQFVLDDEAAADSPPEDRSYSSSQTESLLGGPHSPILEKPRSRVVVPTREQVLAGGRGRRRRGDWRVVVGGLVALLVGAYGVTQLLSLGTRFGRTGPKIQVILMVSDGMGPASETMSRSFLQFLHDGLDSASPSLINNSLWANLDPGFRGKDGIRKGGFGVTPLDSMFVGSSRTRSANSLVTDSAAGATAFSCALKTFNGGIAVEPVEKNPCGTLLEAAKKQGFGTGLVVTSRITHATPASFYAHVVDRDLESEIATFLVGEGPQGQSVDFAFGGGHCFFIPNTTVGSCRTDDKDLISVAEKNGLTVVRGMQELKAWHDGEGHAGTGPVLGLFADSHMDYELDRVQTTVLVDEQPSLREMTMHALTHLQQEEDSKGFFLLVEGARIDHAAHDNDPVGHLGDILAYHDTVRYLKEWVTEQNKHTPTVLISVSDHETGGLALGRQLGEGYPEYAWYPDALLNATHSTPWLGAQIAANPDVSREWLREEMFVRGLGITDVTEDELDALWPHRADSYRSNRILADAISRRAQVGWSTAGHSGVDVNFYAFGFNSSGLTGNVENTDVGGHIASMMGLNLDLITQELNKNLDEWHSTSAGHSSSNPVGIGHYHGEH